MVELSEPARGLHKVAKKIGDLRPEETLRRNPAEADAPNFEAVFPKFRVLIALFSPFVNELNCAAFPDDIVENLRSRANSTWKRYSEILAFYQFNPHNVPMHDDLVKAVKNDFSAIIQQQSSFIGTAMASADAAVVLNEVTERYQVLVSDVERMRDELADLLAGKAISVHEEKFIEAAAANARTGCRWLSAATALAAVVVAASVAFVLGWLGDLSSEDYLQVAQVTGGKALGVLVLISAAVWCGRNYRVVMNLHEVNLAKARALHTCEAFVAAADKPEMRDQVLLETTRAIFSLPASGYVSGGADSGMVSPLMVLQQVMREGQSRGGS